MNTQCPYCLSIYRHLPDSYLGKKTACRTCKKSIRLKPMNEKKKQKIQSSDLTIYEIQSPKVKPKKRRSNQYEQPLVAQARAVPDFVETDPFANLSIAQRPVNRTYTPTAMRRTAQARQRTQSHSRHDSMQMGLGARSAPGAQQAFTFGILALIFFPLAPLFSILAIMNAQSARKNIIRSRGHMSGREQASTGATLAMIGFVLFFVGAAVTIGLAVANRSEPNQPATITPPQHTAPTTPATTPTNSPPATTVPASTPPATTPPTTPPATTPPPAPATTPPTTANPPAPASTDTPPAATVPPPLKMKHREKK